MVLAYAVFGTMVATVSGGSAPSIRLVSGTTPTVLGIYFAVVPLAGLWFVTAGRRQRRADQGVSQS